MWPYLKTSVNVRLPTISLAWFFFMIARAFLNGVGVRGVVGRQDFGTIGVQWLDLEIIIIELYQNIRKSVQGCHAHTEIKFPDISPTEFH